MVASSPQRRSAAVPSESYDFIVMGAGTAGCVLANRLSERADLSVCLVEAGDRDCSPFIKVPAAVAFTVLNPKLSWGYQAGYRSHTATTVECCCRGDGCWEDRVPPTAWSTLVAIPATTMIGPRPAPEAGATPGCCPPFFAQKTIRPLRIAPIIASADRWPSPTFRKSIRSSPPFWNRFSLWA